MSDAAAAGKETRAVDGEVVAATLGAALRRLRKAQRLTLQQLASRCGLSQPFLSQLENGKAMPSLMALHNVAQALKTTAHDLLQPQGRLDISLVRHGEGDTYQLVEGASVRFLTRGGSHLMEPNEVEFQPGAGTVNAGHEGEEVIYVLEGRMRVELEGSEPVELARGDVYTYPATTPHTMTAAGQAGCRFLVVTSPPSF
ncbi:MAG: XRE family transcriptional regulator [bacterium]|nr:XRE family transcriptional regulator [bacterium]